MQYLHLLYARFITKVLRDLGMVDHERAIHPTPQSGDDPGGRGDQDEQEPGHASGAR